MQLQQKKPNFIPLLYSSSITRILEVLGYHPIDTTIKRFQNSRTKFYSTKSITQGLLQQYRQTLFMGQQHFINKVISLYSGGLWSGMHKIVTRTFTFSLQPEIVSLIESNNGDWFKSYFGNNAAVVINASAGATIGIAESFIFMPLDSLKVRYQNGEQRSTWKLITSENLFRGTL